MIQIVRDKWESLEEKHRQTARAVLIIIIIIILSCAVNYARTDNKKLYDKEETRIDFADVKGKGKIEDAWLERSEIQLDELKDQLAQEQKDKEELQQKLEDLTTEVENANQKNQQQFQSQIEELRKEANENKKSPASELQDNRQGGDSLNDPFGRVASGDINSNYEGDIESPSYSENRQIDLVNFSSNQEKNSFALDNYIPAGSYAKAVLISSVDASVGISSQSDPRPVLFRIIEQARSVIDKGKQLITNIKGCTVTGAASADLSSERTYVRLLKMTCPDGNGGVIETDVEGYAADGSDGKSGLVGKKISREGDLLAKSFLAGMVSGFGQGLSEKVTPPLAFSNGLTTQGTLSNEDVARKGLGKGISSSSERLSNYMIDRAEQYQPVISVTSGKEAELVFISGTYLDGRKSSPKGEVKK